MSGGMIGGPLPGSVVMIDQQTFTASGTWTKPADVLPTDLVVIDLFGGGGAGGVTVSTTTPDTAGGGGGGAHNRVQFRAYELSATEPVVVGAGGVGGTVSTAAQFDGPSGGASSFKGHIAYGGGGGGGGNVAIPGSGGGCGGGILSPGQNGHASGTNQTRAGGAPQVYRQFNEQAGSDTESNRRPFPGEWGGAGNNPYHSGSAPYTPYLPTLHQPVHGGAACLPYPDPALRSSVWGGAAGGCYCSGTGAGSQTGGASQFGGNGGSTTIPAGNTSNVNGTDGAPRGGGGAGAKRGTSGTVTSGSGGRGEVVITILRGA